MNADPSGNFTFRDLAPGTYQVNVEKSGFKSYKASGAQVNANQVTTIQVKLEVGAMTQTVEVTSPAVRIDTSSTNVTTHVTDTTCDKLPLARNVAGLFYIAPGVAGGIGTGYANPSISGGSGLENMYVADGVNISDAGYGALGVWSQQYGAIGTGINMSFVKEVNIKTGGFEPQYGKATGGIVQIVTKSGTDRYHGSITGFFEPKGIEATRLHPDDFGLVNTYGKELNKEDYDVAGEFGGPVPGVRKYLFFYGSFDYLESDLQPGTNRFGALSAWALYALHPLPVDERAGIGNDPRCAAAKTRPLGAARLQDEQRLRRRLHRRCLEDRQTPHSGRGNQVRAAADERNCYPLYLHR